MANNHPSIEEDFSQDVKDDQQNLNGDEATGENGTENGNDNGASNENEHSENAHEASGRDDDRLDDFLIISRRWKQMKSSISIDLLIFLHRQIIT